MRKYLILLMLIFANSSAQDLATLHDNSGVKSPLFFDSSEFRGYEYETFGITEIGIQKTSCFGQCPSFQLIIHSDGVVDYEGYGFVEKVGRFKGRLEQYQLINILAYINEIKFMELQDVYSYGVTDHATVYTMVKTNSEQKIISNYANTGPLKLWALEQLLTQLLNEVKWENE